MTPEPNPGDALPVSGMANGGIGGAMGDLPAPPPIPDHKLLRNIGRGSYGSVWLGRNLMGVYRAIKIVYRSAFKDGRPFERELSGIRKFEPISRSHEGFVDVLHIGQNEEAGCFYYVMELGDDVVRGQDIDPQTYSPLTLSKRIGSHGRLPVADCVKLGLELSQALSELHRNGLVHRDVKPSNIVFSGGIPKLADIGLVAESNKELSYVGTEGFIPPEGPGSAQADIFSLGKVLYEAATGKDRMDFPELPPGFEKQQDATGFLELNDVILKACATKTEDRYATAWDMHADLVVLANGKSVKRLRALERGLARLKRAVVYAVGVVICLGVVGFEIYRSTESARKARERLVGEKVANWTSAVERGDMLGALVDSVDALIADKDDPENVRAHRLRFGSALAQCPKVTYCGCGSATAFASEGVFWPDEAKILVTRLGAPMEIHDLETGVVDTSWPGAEHKVRTVSFDAHGRRMVTGENGYRVCVWDPIARTKLREIPQPAQVNSAEISADGKWLVTACEDGSVQVYNVDTGHKEPGPPKSEKTIFHAAFSHDGRIIATAGADHSTRLYHAQTGKPICEPLMLTRWVRHVAFNPDDTKLAVACEDHTVRIYDLTQAKVQQIQPEMRHLDAVLSVDWSPDGRLLVTASLDGTVGLWTAEGNQPNNPNPSFRLGERGVFAKFDQEGCRIVMLGMKGTTKVFDLAGCQRPPTPLSWSFSQDKKRFLKIEGDRLQVMDSVSGAPDSPPIKVEGPLVEACLDSYGRKVIARVETLNPERKELATLIWDAATGAPAGPPLPVDVPLAKLVISPDGHRVAALDGKVGSVWDIASASQACSPVGHESDIRLAVWSPDSSRIATISLKEAKVWDPATGRQNFEPIKPPKPNHDFNDIQFSPDGLRFVLSEREEHFEECAAMIRRTATGELLAPPLGHGDGVLAGLFSGDGLWIATAGEDFKVNIWSSAHGNHTAGPLQHGHQVMSLDFSSDSRWLATASYDKTTVIWRREGGEPLTPPFRLRFGQVDVKFLDHERKLALTTSRSQMKQTWIWDIQIDSRPIREMQLLAGFLNGACPEGPPGAVWKRFRELYPQDFRTTFEDVVAWHRNEADRAQDAITDGKPQEAARKFHLDQLAELERKRASAPAPGAAATAH
jgi:WD40 repeat protein